MKNNLLNEKKPWRKVKFIYLLFSFLLTPSLLCAQIVSCYPPGNQALMRFKVVVIQKPSGFGFSKVLVSPLYLSPSVYKYSSCSGFISMMEEGLAFGSNLAINDPPPVSFPLLIEDSSATYCYIKRSSEESHIGGSGFDPLNYGQIGSIADGSIILLSELLNKQIDTIRTIKGDYIYRLEPFWSVNLNAPTEFSSSAPVCLQANVQFDDGLAYDQGFGTPYVVPWFYQVNDGPTQSFTRPPSANEIIFNMKDLPSVKPGNNVIVCAWGRPNPSNRIIIRFYPELPHLVNPTQVILPGETSLKQLAFRLSRPLNKDLDEKLKVLTCYKDLKMNSQGIYEISDSKVLFQCPLSSSNISEAKLNINIPAGKELPPGDYYITLEGTVRNSSNLPSASGNAKFSAKAKEAMFPCIVIHVIKNELNIYDFKTTPPSCHNGNGSISFETDGSASVDLIQGSTYCKVEEYIDSTWKENTSFTYTSYTSGILLNVRIVAKSDNISPGEHLFRLVQYRGKEVKGYSNFTVNIPNPSEIETPLRVFDISGIGYINGNPSSTKDGRILFSRNKTQGGTPPYQFWYEGSLNGSNLPIQLLKQDTLKSTHPGKVKILVKDQLNCSRVYTIPIEILPDTLQTNITINRSISCYGEADGVLSASLVKGSHSVHYEWYLNGGFLANGPQIGALKAGTYKVVAKANDSPLSSSFQIKLTDPLLFSQVGYSVTPVHCHGDATGKATVIFNGGTPPYSYHWDKVLSYSNSIQNVFSGKYTLFAFDKNNCKASYTVNIPQTSQPLGIVIDTLEHMHYNEKGNLVWGRLSAHAVGGKKPYIPVLYNNSPVKKPLSVGFYEISVYDSLGCYADTSLWVQLFDTLSIQIEKKQDIHCFNGHNGACQLQIRGGRPPFQVKWSNGDTLLSLSNLPAGVYSVSVKDAYHSIKNAHVIFNEPAPLEWDSVFVQYPDYGSYAYGELKKESPNGSISVSVKGGTPPYTYLWQQPNGYKQEKPSPYINHLEEGLYNLVVTDSRLCSFSRSFNLPMVKALEVTPLVVSPIKCHAISSGSIKAVVRGGIPPYRFYWTLPNGEKSQDSLLINLSSGVYEIQVVDANHKTSYNKITLTEPSALQTTLLSKKETSYGGCVEGICPADVYDGSIQMSVQGGTLPYHIQWLDSEGWILSKQTSNDSLSISELKNIGAGRYALWVTDAQQCTDTVWVPLLQSPPLWCGAKIIDSLRCYGEKNGMIHTLVEGGVPPYTYQWTHLNGLPNQDTFSFVFPALWNLSAGIYKLLVQDAKGIQSSFTLQLSQNRKLQCDLSVSPALCASTENGSAEVRVQGGMAPYRYQWTWNGKYLADTTPKIGSLAKGILEVSVKDVYGCTATSTKDVSVPSPIEISFNKQEVSYSGCLYGQKTPSLQNGRIEIEVKGGIPPYRYSWNTGNTSSILNHIDSGIYQITVIDAHLCTQTDTLRIGKEPDLLAQLHLVKEPDCFQNTNGILCVQTQGGTPPYLYEWSSSHNNSPTSTTDTLKHLKAGAYYVSVTDQRGVVSRDSFVLKQPELLNVTANLTPVSGWGAKDGKISVHVSGGTKPYAYIWNTRDSVSELKSLKPGSYQLYLKDALGCTFFENYILHSPDSLKIDYSYLHHCSGSKVFLKDDYSPNHDGSIHIYVSGGTLPYQYYWINSDGDTLKKVCSTRESAIFLDSLSAGTYTLVLEDAHHYRISQSFTLRISTQLQILPQEISPILCAGEKSGILEVLADGGLPPYNYEWICISDHLRLVGEQAITQPLFSGLYQITVTASDGQTKTDSFYLNEPKPLSLEARLQLPIQDSLHQFDGSIQISPSGGYSPYLYRWNHGDSSSHINYKNYQNYTLILYDAHGCSLKKEFPFDKPSKIEAKILCNKRISCFGKQDGSLVLEYKGGKPPYHILWNTGDTTDFLTEIKAGLYKVSILDSFGSSYHCEYRLREPDSLRGTLLFESPSCYLQSNGEIKASLLGGSYPYRYFWSSGQQTPDIYRLPEGLYSLTVIDQNGCEWKDSTRLKSPLPLSAHIVAEVPLCQNFTGDLQAYALGGTPPYSYLWDHPQYSLAIGRISQALPGAYHLTIEDTQKCHFDTIIYLPKPQILEWKLEKEKWLCVNQSIDLSPTFLSDSSNLQAIWTLPNQTMVPAKNLKTSQTGTHILLLVQHQNCIYRDTVDVKGTQDTVDCKFWISTDICQGENAMAADVSHPTSDSSVWLLPHSVQLTQSYGPYAELLFQDTGYFPITLLSYKGPCHQTKTTYVYVSSKKNHRSRKDPSLFSSVKIAPNPNKGETQVHITTSANAQIEYLLIEGAGGKKIQAGNWDQKEKIPVIHSLYIEGKPGLYLLLLRTEKELQTFKIIVTR